MQILYRVSGEYYKEVIWSFTTDGRGFTMVSRMKNIDVLKVVLKNFRSLYRVIFEDLGMQVLYATSLEY